MDGCRFLGCWRSRWLGLLTIAEEFVNRADDRISIANVRRYCIALKNKELGAWDVSGQRTGCIKAWVPQIAAVENERRRGNLGQEVRDVGFNNRVHAHAEHTRINFFERVRYQRLNYLACGPSQRLMHEYLQVELWIVVFTLTCLSEAV
ncbi:MAG: hypothetical protein A2148_09390 [Chloroflexi bacterium RBG_16_68_14]|nr:MAG: hypothetical protein A2148_09390 [Chloroflexi bacterium RBG_16_68_14]